MRQKADREGRPRVDAQLMRALTHDLRVEILALLNEHVASPNELSQEMREPLSQVSYHVRILHECELVELVDTQQVRGSTEHFYRATARAITTAEEFEQMPEEARKRITRSSLSYTFAAASHALATGTLEARSDRHLSSTQMRLDQQGWEDMVAGAQRWLDRQLEIQAESAARLAEADGEGIPVMASNLLYETPPDSKKAGPRQRE